MYRLHHCVMHHLGNNKQGQDRSSTENFQRNNLVHFVIHWTRHALLGPIEVPFVAFINQRWSLLAACLATELSYITVVAWLFFNIAPIATSWVFILPYIVSSFALMFGNWSQHCFVDPSKPHCNYKLTYNCVGTLENQKSFNDGYHIVHHKASGLHWSELPSRFIKDLEDHAENDAFVFLNIGFFDVGAAVLAGKWDFLVKHFARYSKKFAEMSDEEVVEELKRRLQPIK
jgi:fatty acid desaturase